MTPERRPTGIGGTLRAARERKGRTLADVAAATKIAVRVLESLERDDISKLPGGIFGRSFVRAYAEAVGLDPDDIVRRFIAQFPDTSITAGHPASTAAAEDNETFESSRRVASTTLWLIAVSVLIAGLLLYFIAGASASERGRGGSKAGLGIGRNSTT
jgi:cytoskeletal protein RodZ